MFNIESFLGSTGVMTALATIGILVFAECGFLFGLFMPGGEIILPIAGFFASKGILPLGGVLIVAFIGAVAGYEAGYYIGVKSGRRIFKRKGGTFFRKAYVTRTHAFYERHGGKTVLISRFIGYVRTVAPLVAGLSGMQRRKYVIYNVTGAFFWTLALVMVGYWFGSEFIHL